MLSWSILQIFIPKNVLTSQKLSNTGGCLWLSISFARPPRSRRSIIGVGLGNSSTASGSSDRGLGGR